MADIDTKLKNLRVTLDWPKSKTGVYRLSDAMIKDIKRVCGV